MRVLDNSIYILCGERECVGFAQSYGWWRGRLTCFSDRAARAGVCSAVHMCVRVCKEQTNPELRRIQAEAIRTI